MVWSMRVSISNLEEEVPMRMMFFVVRVWISFCDRGPLMNAILIGGSGIWYATAVASYSMLGWQQRPHDRSSC